MRHRIIFTALLSFVLAANAQTISLADCIRQGIANNLSLENARTDIARARTGVSQNRARLLPVINGVFQLTDYLKQPVNVTTGTLLGNDFPDDPTWQTIRSMQYNAGAGVQLQMPLYAPEVYASVDVASTVERLSRLSYDKVADELTMQIAKVYFMAQSTQAQALLATGNIGRMEQLCDITRAMFDQGVVLEVDFDRVNINLQNLKAVHGALTTLYARQMNMLRFLMDLAPDTPLDVEPMADSVAVFRPAGLSDGLPELQAAAMRKTLVERRIRAVKAGYIPSVSLIGYAGALGYQERFGHFFHTEDASRNWFGNCFIGLKITVPIFDAGARKLKIRQYRYEAEQAENNAALLRARMERDYSDALLQLDHNIDVYRTRSQSYRQARDVYDVTEEQYREGVASMTALLQDDMQLRAAQADCVEAICRFNLARLDLLRLSGNLSSLTE